MADSSKEGSFDDIKKAFESYGKPIEKVLEAIGGMYGEASKVSRAFVDGRVRLDEMNKAAADAAASVIRLGGNIGDVGNTMVEIAKGSQRNVIATEEQVTKLYAASEILEKSVSGLVEGFGDVGIGVSQIGENLEKSIDYIKNVGLNAREVMGKVTENMSQMNRFQFEGGVQGLAKMAAQASMLKFDMGQTFKFADDMLDPERAVDMAAAFQRLGVVAGDLVDPFQLMNQSINDPTGLQNSLARLGEKYTFFDEQTKTFKINQEGVLTLRQMEKEAGLASGSLSKAAVAAKDLDRRVSAINPSLHFDSEEDKQFLANMATMNKEGEYTVQLKNDKTGEVEIKNLSDVTQDEMEKLRQQYEESPKTLEDIQKKQLGVQEDIRRAIEAPLNKVAYGVAGTPQISGNIVGLEKIARNIGNAIDKQVPESAIIGEKLKDTFKEIEGLMIQKEGGKLSDVDFATKVERIQNSLESKANSLGKSGMDALKDILTEVNAKTKGSSGIEQKFREVTAEMLGQTTQKKSTTYNVAKPASVSGYKPITMDSILSKGGQGYSGAKTTNVKFGGKTTIVHEFKYPSETDNVSKEVFEKFVNANKEYFASEEFKKVVYEANLKTSKELETSR